MKTPVIDRWRGHCTTCDQPIQPGQPITLAGRAYVHADHSDPH